MEGSRHVFMLKGLEHQLMDILISSYDTVLFILCLLLSLIVVNNSLMASLYYAQAKGSSFQPQCPQSTCRHPPAR